MNTEQTNVLTVEEAIRISKLICSVSEERIPMVLDVLSKAGVNINGLDELEEWKALKDQAYIVDIDEFVSELVKSGESNGTGTYLRPNEFSEVCKRFNVKPSCAKRALHRKGRIKTAMDGPKLSYTVPVWIGGKTERCIVILKEGQHG